MRGVALALAAIALLAATTRTVRYDGHQVTIERKGDVEHITITDKDGAVGIETWCDRDSGSYDQIVSLGHALVAAAKRDDRHALAGLMQFPLTVNIGVGSGVGRRVRHISIADRSAFLARYRSIVTPHVLELLRQDEPREAFCRNGMSMVGDGLMWATADRRGHLKVAVVNR